MTAAPAAALNAALNAVPSASMGVADFLRIQARSNRLCNHRLHQAMAGLTPQDLAAPRTSFFPSLGQTLNHILDVDGFYVGALHAEPDLAGFWHRCPVRVTMAEITAAQAAVDERLIAFCERLVEADVARVVEMPRDGGRRVQRDRVVYVLAHLFQHQTHHRGQVHAMLSGTEVAPPQLDEFQMASEAHLRTADMAGLGWREAEVWRPLGPP